MPPRKRIRLSPEKLATALGGSWPAAEVDAAIQMLGREGKFPPGLRRLPADLVSAVQRERMLVAMMRAVSELGYRDVNVQDVLERAAVSRPTFYEHFTNKEACFLAALDVSATRLRGRIAAAAVDGGDDWRERMRLGLEELLRFAVEESDAARALIVEARGASSAALERRDALLEQFADCIDAEARELLPDASPGPPIASAGIVGGIESLLYARLNQDRFEELEYLLPSLMYFVVQAYEGHEAASAEISVATP